MAAKEERIVKHHSDLFQTKKKPTGELKELHFNSVAFKYIDGSTILVSIDGEPQRNIFLNPVDAQKLIDFLREYTEQY